ncbi:MAG: DUF1569 domain-containing protein [Bacteroidetes bacterium]|nr:DUF1569 domain-containing protein [Bacteroidota bacterium]HET6245496.1 DUF1569 domain-containing protein [Bacteroidia bacterium]
MKNIFNQLDTQEIINRINKLSPTTGPLWGKMAVGQMLAHCNVSYEFVYDNKHAKPSAFNRFILKLFVKNIVISEKSYKKNGQTAPQFIIKEDKNFEAEKKRLIDYIKKTQELGEKHFDGRESLSFGALSVQEWNNMFYKHLDHHLNQFGV